ncbi:MAG: sulfatase [Gemmataceae bacterium]
MLRFLAVLLTFLAGTGAATAADARPNIVWIFVDDMSANFSCYGEKTIQTPHVDRMAAEGTRFSRAFVTAPVCSPCRSALITGMYQTSIGAHHHRSGRGVEKIHLPDGVDPVPVLFQRAGYYTCNSGWPVGKNFGKTDYNFEWDRQMYDGNDWSERRPGQPFFAQIQLPGGKYRGNNGLAANVRQTLDTFVDPDKVRLPPYYPDDPVIRRDWAWYLDTVRYTDWQVGQILQRLDEEKLLDDTVVFFMTDHGISHARGKQFLYEEGIQVPFVARGPRIDKGKVRADLVEHIDMAAMSLGLAGIDIPKTMQGKNVLANDYVPRDVVFAARDRCDETVEHMRAVRGERFKYIRNFLPQRPHLQPNRYKDDKAIIQSLRALHAAGKLNELPERLLFAPTRPAEELYDLQSDPFELKNLAVDPKYRKTLEELRQRLEQWMEATNDHGRQPESAAMYDSDMAVYLQGKQGDQGNILRQNIALMKQWAKEGK